MKVYIDGSPGPDRRRLEKPVGWCGPGVGMSRATYVTRRKEWDDPVHFNNIRERIQGGQRRRASGAVGSAGREDKCGARVRRWTGTKRRGR